MIGRRLTLARTSAGLSLRALAEKIDNLVSAQAISKYERDEMMPGSKVLMALARALGTTETYLLSTGGFKLTSLEFRKKQISGSKEEATVEAMTLSAVERYLEIEDILGFPARRGPCPWARPSRCATSLRLSLQPPGCAQPGALERNGSRTLPNSSRSAA